MAVYISPQIYVKINKVWPLTLSHIFYEYLPYGIDLASNQQLVSHQMCSHQSLTPKLTHRLHNVLKHNYLFPCWPLLHTFLLAEQKSSKRRMSLISWAFKRGSSPEQAVQSESPVHIAPASGHLFGRPLSDVIIDNTLPSPIVVGTVCTENPQILGS